MLIVAMIVSPKRIPYTNENLFLFLSSADINFDAIYPAIPKNITKYKN
jgi:hypothetical protein